MIDDYTNGRGANASEILRIYYRGEDSEVFIGKLVLCFHILFTPSTLIVIGCVLCYFYKFILGFLDNEEDKYQAIATKLIIIILNLLFCVYVFILDCCAIDFHNNKLPSAVTEYHNCVDSKCFYNLPVLTLVYDVLISLLSPASMLALRCLDIIASNLLDSFVLISIFTIMGTIGNHLPYILIAVINSPLYASGIIIYYTLFVASYVPSINIIVAKTYGYYKDKMSEMKW